MCFIDCRKAFDCVNHKLFWHIMTTNGYPANIRPIQLIAHLYSKQESMVRTSCGDSDWFTVGQGVWQGCVISPSLYNIYADEVMREVLEVFKGGIRIGGERISNPRFADDTTLLCTRKEELLKLLRKVKDISKNKNLELNVRKTKVMVIDPRRSQKEDIYLGSELIEEVDHFVYLGSMINSRSTSKQE